MATATTTTTEAGKTIAITPTPAWTPLPIEGEIPPPFKTPKFGFEVIPLHPTFACELKGVDWSRPIPKEEYEEIRQISNKVSSHHDFEHHNVQC